jgi:hypothetical protein
MKTVDVANFVALTSTVFVLGLTVDEAVRRDVLVTVVDRVLPGLVTVFCSTLVVVT